MSTDMKVLDFITAVRTQPLPGGGSVTALAGALASSLLGKVCRLTAGRDEFLPYEEQTWAIWRECQILNDEFIALMDRDTQAYQRVVDSYRLPQVTSGEQKARTEALEEAWKTAVETPSEIAAKCRRIIELARPLVGRSNKTTTSDIGIAANMAYGALEAAVIIIKDNLTKVKDQVYVDRKLIWADKLATSAAVTWEDIKYQIDNLCGCIL